MPKVSVIMPVFNAQNSIARAIDSVLSQTFQDYELIIVNDGSTDESDKVVRTFINDNKVDSIRYSYQNNEGPASARNSAIQQAKGEWIAFLDADDTWEPEKLTKQLKVAKNYPDAGLVYCDMQHTDNGQLVYSSYLHGRAYKQLGSGQIYDNLLLENFIFTPTVFMKREVFDSVGLFNETLKICEDYDLWLRIAQKFNIRFLDEALVVRDRTGENITNNQKLYIESCIALRKNLLAQDTHQPHRIGLLKRQLVRDHFALAYCLFDLGEMEESRKLFRQTIKVRPYMIKSLFYWTMSYLPKPVIDLLRKVKQRGRRG